MDTEAYKMALTIFYDLIQKAPVAVTTIVVTVVLAYAAHKSKVIPYQVIHKGVNGHTIITADDLKAHCHVAHEPLIDALKSLSQGQGQLTEHQRTIQNDVVLIRETVSYIKGQLSERAK